MKSYIALFRGINVGGRNKLPMRELMEVLKGLGLRNIQTYIQSGNVVFQGEKRNLSELAGEIGVAIRKTYGFTPSVILLEPHELEKAIASNPYPEAEAEPKTLHLYFLDSVPEHPDLDTLENLRRENEHFELEDKIFYLHAPDGIGRSKLAARVEKSLGVPVTARNWRSVRKIMSMVEQIE